MRGSWNPGKPTVSIECVYEPDPARMVAALVGLLTTSSAPTGDVGRDAADCALGVLPTTTAATRVLRAHTDALVQMAEYLGWQQSDKEIDADDVPLDAVEAECCCAAD
jgi:hypothetical protein